jgi:hypothetical protein
MQQEALGTKNKGVRTPAPDPERVVNEGRVDDELDLRSWIAQMGSTEEVAIRLIRRSPRLYKGISIEGTIGTFHELVDEDFVKEHYGGGLYTIQLMRRDAKGRLSKPTSRNLRIAGPPKVDDLLAEAGVGQNQGGMTNDAAGLAGQAMNTLKWQLESALDRGERSERSSGIDPILLQTVIEPMREQVRSLASAITTKDQQILQLMGDYNKRPEGSTVQDRIFEKMVDGESARIEAIRTQHDSELRQLKTIHQAELDRERDRAERDLERLEKQHTRELDSVNKAQMFASSALTTTYETRIDSLKSEIARLQGEMTESKVQIGELKAKKEKTLPEQAQEIVAMQEALKSIGIGGKDEDPDEGKSIIERIASRIIENPEAIGQVIGGVRGASGPSPEEVALEQARAIAAQQHQARLIAAKRKKRARAQAAAAGAPVPVSASPVAELPQAEVMLALQFMEGAIQNGTEPAMFAATARAAIPGDILSAIERVGVDEFLNSVTLPQDSLLRSQRGRNYAREVARILLQGA